MTLHYNFLRSANLSLFRFQFELIFVLTYDSICQVIFSLTVLILTRTKIRATCQRWSPLGRPWPRGRPRKHFFRSLALASKLKSFGLGLVPYNSSKMSCLRLENSIIFDWLKRKKPKQKSIPTSSLSIRFLSLFKK